MTRNYSSHKGNLIQVSPGVLHEYSDLPELSKSQRSLDVPSSTLVHYHPAGRTDPSINTQQYISFKCKQPLEATTIVNNCLSDIRRWMITNQLKINDSKTEFIVFRSPQLSSDLSGLSVNVGDYAIFKGKRLGCHIRPISQL